MIKYFNGDNFVAEKIIFLKKKWNIKTVIETGTFEGDSTLWFSENFEKVHTIEINEEYQKIAKENCKDKKNINFLLGNSIEIFPSLLYTINERVIFYLDAHEWGKTCPTPQELAFITGMTRQNRSSQIEPIIIIHDFKNPNHLNYKWNTHINFEYKWENVEPFIRNIYKDKFLHYYNDEAAGAKVGVLYVEPIIEK